MKSDYFPTYKKEAKEQARSTTTMGFHTHMIYKHPRLFNFNC